MVSQTFLRTHGKLNHAIDITTFTAHRERGSGGLNVIQQGSKELNKNLFLLIPDPGSFFVTKHRRVHMEQPHKYMNPMSIH